MTNFGGIGALARPSTAEDWIAAEFRAMKERIRQLETAQPYAMASSNFDGTLNPASVGTQGWALNADGIAILNSVMMRSGAIPNNALQAAMLPGVGQATASNFTIPSGTGTVRTTITLPVPAGYSQLFFYASVRDYAVNNTGATDWLNSVLVITPPTGSALFANGSSPRCATGTETASSAFLAQQLTTLAAGNVTFASRPASSNATWGTNAVNSTAVSVLGLFVR